MDSKLCRTGGKWLYRQFWVLLCVLVVSGDFLINLARWEHMYSWHMVHMVLTAVLLVMVLFRLPGMKSPEGWLVISLSLWVLLTRIFLGAFQVGFHRSVFCAAKMCAVFTAGYLLEDELRKELLHSETALLGVLLSVCSVLAICVIQNGGIAIPLFGTTIHITEEMSLYGIHRHIGFFMVHRNESAVWFFVAMCLLGIPWFACKRKIFRIPLGAAIAVLYMSIVLQHSRTAYVITAVGAAMLAILLVQEKLKTGRSIVRFSAAVLAAILALTVTYKSFDTINSLIVIEPPQASQETEMTEDTQLVDNRDLWEDMKTFTLRTGIWQNVAESVRNNPRVLLFGLPENLIMEYLHTYGGLIRDVPHTHNMFTQVLMLCGLTGLLLLMALIALLVVKMILFFFSAAPIQEKVLTIPLTGVLIHGLMEPVFTDYIKFTSVLFMLLASIFLRTYEQRRKAS